jgi:TRAP-type C4-dicarboxylate transport system permease small subunit
VIAQWQRVLAGLAFVSDRLNRLFVGISMIATVAASVVLTSSVFLRYALHAPTDWQDEVSVFLLVFMTFGASGWVQQHRGHVAIEAVASLLSPRVNAWRLWVADLIVLLFCGFFTDKAWSMVMEAWSEGMTTSSDWAPPLWFPYGLMAVGVSSLLLQVAVQVLSGPRQPLGAT